MSLSYLSNDRTLDHINVDTALSHLSLSPNGEQQEQHIPNEEECPCYMDTLNLRRRNLEQPTDILHYLYVYATMSDLLVELNLSRNDLSDLPMETKQLCNLRQLNLAYNRFTKLPSVLCNMSSLHHLDITGNQLEHLDKLPLALPHLKTLRVSGNRLERLDDRMDVWTHMTCLQLGSECGGNRLTGLPSTLARMMKLEQLDLANNLLHTWPLHLPPALKHLTLSGNQLKEMPRDGFEGCPYLETLDISSNRLTCLPSMMHHTLQRLDLSNNNIYIVPTTLLASSTHVILVGNPVLDYHRKSTTSYAQRLRELSTIAVLSSTHDDCYLDIALIDSLNSTRKATLSSPPSLWNDQDIITKRDDSQQEKIYTCDGQLWVPSLKELVMRSTTHLNRKHWWDDKDIPHSLLDDLKMGNACDTCGTVCINEWLGAIHVKAYQTYTSVVCKVALCSTLCWLTHYQKTRAPASSSGLPDLIRSPAALTSLAPDSFEWIVAAATASAIQLEEGRALE